MLTFIAIAVGAVALWILVGALRPLVERSVITTADWERVEDEALALLDQRDRLVAELRELEFEATLNKISHRDLEGLRRRYEAEAIDLDRRLETQLDTYGARIEADVEARLQGAAAAPPPAAEAEPPPAAPVAGTCARCGTANRPGARFCNDCGAPLTLPAGAPT